MKKRHNKLNFKKVWLMFQEIAEGFKETKKMIQETDRLLSEKFRETDRLLSEKFQETEKQFQETEKQFQETEKQFKRTDKKLRDLESLFVGQWGKLIESLVEGNLIKILKERNIDVERTYQREKKLYKGRNYEFDIVARNGQDVVVVEVKTSLKVWQVQDFVEELVVIKEVFPDYKEKNVYGAIAFLRAEEEADKYAYREGLFVIKATADSAKILNDSSFAPKKW